MGGKMFGSSTYVATGWGSSARVSPVDTLMKSDDPPFMLSP